MRGAVSDGSLPRAEAMTEAKVSRPALALVVVALVMTFFGACQSNRRKYPVQDIGNKPVLTLDGGSIQISATANHCPTLTVAAAPPQAQMGGQIDVSASASDPDPEDAVTLAWTVTAGVIADSAMTHTAYTCTTPGPQSITVVASDGRCQTTQKLLVYCYGVVSDGGLPDTAASGGAGGAAPGGTGGTAGVFGGGGGRGSGGIGGAGAAPAGTGGGVPPSSCTGQFDDQGPVCEACTVDNCYAPTDGCSDLSPDDTLLCKALYCCLVATRCDLYGSGHKCLCGSSPDCKGPNGLCKSEIQAAGKKQDSDYLILNFVNPDLPLGKAVNLATCRANYCATPLEGNGAGGAAAAPQCDTNPP